MLLCCKYIHTEHIYHPESNSISIRVCYQNGMSVSNYVNANWYMFGMVCMVLASNNARRLCSRHINVRAYFFVHIRIPFRIAIQANNPICHGWFIGVLLGLHYMYISSAEILLKLKQWIGFWSKSHCKIFWGRSCATKWITSNSHFYDLENLNSLHSWHRRKQKWKMQVKPLHRV